MIAEYHIIANWIIYGQYYCYDHLFFTEIKAPIAVLGAEIDEMSPPEHLRQFEEVLAARPEVQVIPAL